MACSAHAHAGAGRAPAQAVATRPATAAANRPTAAAHGPSRDSEKEQEKADNRSGARKPRRKKAGLPVWFTHKSAAQ